MRHWMVDMPQSEPPVVLNRLVGRSTIKQFQAGRLPTGAGGMSPYMYGGLASQKYGKRKMYGVFLYHTAVKVLFSSRYVSHTSSIWPSLMYLNSPCDVTDQKTGLPPSEYPVSVSGSIETPVITLVRMSSTCGLRAVSVKKVAYAALILGVPSELTAFMSLRAGRRWLLSL